MAEFVNALEPSDDNSNESNDSEDDNNEALIHDDPPLFPGCPLTLSESLLSVLALTLRHIITGVLLASILQLVHMHCPEPNHCVESLYMFNTRTSDDWGIPTSYHVKQVILTPLGSSSVKKYFKHLKNPVNRHLLYELFIQSWKSKSAVSTLLRPNNNELFYDHFCNFSTSCIISVQIDLL